MLATRGTCALVGVAHPRADAAINMASMLRGRMLVGVTEGDVVPRVFIPQMIEWWREGRFPFDRFVRYCDFAQIDEAVQVCGSGDVIKPVVRMER